MKLNLFEFEKNIVPAGASNFQQDIISHVNSRDRIISEFSRIPLNSILSLYEKSYFKLDPEYQRHLKWSDAQKSKLIESLILNIPIPPVFLYEYSLSKTEVMDGIQRISAIIDFLLNKYNLKDLLFLHELNGKRFSELDEDSQNSITRRHLSAIIILNESSNNPIKEKQIKRLNFERLNTGGVLLTSQEVRHAIYPGRFLDVCIELSKYENFKKLWDIDNNKRGSLDRKYEELVLRFFALRSISTFHAENKNIEGLAIVHQLFPFFMDNIKTDCFVQSGKLLFCPVYAEINKKRLFDSILSIRCFLSLKIVFTLLLTLINSKISPFKSKIGLIVVFI